jgi:hypothetical protein
MKRLTNILFAAVALAVPFTACAQQGVSERTEAKVDYLSSKVDQILQLLQTGKPPVVPPTGEPTNPTTPPAAGCSCSPGGHYEINGQGTIRGICTPATLTVSNAMPGARLDWAKMPIVVPGKVKMTEGGRPVGGDGYGPVYLIPMGTHTYQLTPELPCVNLVVQVS